MKLCVLYTDALNLIGDPGIGEASTDNDPSVWWTRYRASIKEEKAAPTPSQACRRGLHRLWHQVWRSRHHWSSYINSRGRLKTQGAILISVLTASKPTEVIKPYSLSNKLSLSMKILYFESLKEIINICGLLHVCLLGKLKLLDISTSLT